MKIFSTTGVITPQQDKTNITLNFDVPQGVKTLKINYCYNPKLVDKANANQSIANAMKKYSIDFANPEAFLPVKNLITLSFDECGEYRGACHRQPNEQLVVISSENSTPGIFNRPIKAGKWSVVLNAHFVGCDVDYNIDINGEVE